jgi:hypothetical protein
LDVRFLEVVLLIQHDGNDHPFCEAKEINRPKSLKQVDPTLTYSGLLVVEQG